jgi:hypothetical protein
VPDAPAQPAANPAVVALLSADGVHRDSLGKMYLLGVFNRINASTFPVVHPRLTLYVALTDGYGSAQLAVRLVSAADDDRPLFEADVPVTFPTPLEVVEVVMHLPGTTFPDPGEYRWQVSCGTEVLAERRLIANLTAHRIGASAERES